MVLIKEKDTHKFIILMLVLAAGSYLGGYYDGFGEGKQRGFDEIILGEGDSCLLRVTSKTVGDRYLYDHWCVKSLRPELNWLIGVGRFSR